VPSYHGRWETTTRQPTHEPVCLAIALNLNCDIIHMHIGTWQRLSRSLAKRVDAGEYFIKLVSKLLQVGLIGQVSSTGQRIAKARRCCRRQNI
jgi:hypothetical protein